jgi:hypothetical protein
MTDPSFLLTSSAAKDLTQLARDLQAMVDLRTANQAEPLSGVDFEFDLAVPETRSPAHTRAQ